MAAFFKSNHYIVGNQAKAEQLLENWGDRDFSGIVEYCKGARFFQDVPFSLPDTYKALDEAFPGSKFILTVRSSGEEWYQSLVQHHSRSFSSGEGVPTKEDLKNFRYRNKYKGYILRAHELIYGFPKVPLYEKNSYIKHYEEHNQQVKKYFESRPDDLLVINLEEKDSFKRLCEFLDLDLKKTSKIPHLNRNDGAQKES